MLLSPGIFWILILFAGAIGIYAQFRVSSAFKKYSQVTTRRGFTGAQVAAEILSDAGIHDVSIERAQTFLGDHYDPTKKCLFLSPSVYDSRSVAAVGVAAHECGHAIQHAHAYLPLKA